MFSSLLMLNFLITVFSETHERVLANSVNFEYLTKSEFNVECLAFLKTFGLLKELDHQLVTLKANDGIDSEVEA